MKRMTLTAGVIGCFVASTAFADMTEVDTDGDMMASFEELVAVYPDVTEDSFAEMDTNGDGLLDETEMTAAMDAGMLTKEG